MTIEIAEIQYESGQLHFRYARQMSAEGDRWIRNGLFQSFYENGQMSAEGEYKNGVEEGQWTTFHENGQKASQGTYVEGKEQPDWKFWDASGQPEH